MSEQKLYIKHMVWWRKVVAQEKEESVGSDGEC